MAARAPLAVPHSAASTSALPAAGLLAPPPTARSLRSSGSRGGPLLEQRPARRVRHIILRRSPERSPTHPATGNAAEAAPAEELARKLQGVEVFDLSSKAVPIVDLWKDRKAVVAFARHFGCVLCRKKADLLASQQVPWLIPSPAYL